MIYPHNYERKIGIDNIRLLLKERCLSSLGKLLVDEMAFCKDAATINEWLEQVREFRRLRQERADVPLTFFFDVRPALKRIRLENTHFEVEELFDFRRSLDTIHRLVVFIRGLDEELDEDGHIAEKHYEALYRLADGVATFPILIQQADQIVDKFGHVRDTASPELNQIRRELARVEGSVSRTLHAILRSAQSEGLVDKDVAPSLRDGRLVIPIAPGVKRKISGIVHDESASGRTLYIEPTEVVEANNKIRDLENQEAPGDYPHPHHLHQARAPPCGRDHRQLRLPRPDRPHPGQGPVGRVDAGHGAPRSRHPRHGLDRGAPPAAGARAGRDAALH